MCCDPPRSSANADIVGEETNCTDCCCSPNATHGVTVINLPCALCACVLCVAVRPARAQMRTSWAMRGIKRSPEGGYILAFDTPEGPKRLQAKVAVCTAPAHRLSAVEGLTVRLFVVGVRVCVFALREGLPRGATARRSEPYECFTCLICFCLFLFF